MTYTVAYEQASQYTAAQDRKMMQTGLMMYNRTTARGGVLPAVDDNSFKPYFSTGMTVMVYAGTAIVAPDYRVNLDVNVSVAIPPGDATARTDLVVLRVYDTEAGDAENKAAVEVVKGTSAAVPPTPARCLALAQVAVAANASSINSAAVNDVRQFTSSAGGVLRAPDAATPFGGVPSGTIVFDPVANDYYMVRNSGVLAPLGNHDVPYLWVGGINSQAALAVYKYLTIMEDTAGGWDLANGRYKVPRTGIYAISVGAKVNGTPALPVPVIQTATTVTGTYTNRVQAAAVGNSSGQAWGGASFSAIMRLNANSGLRIYESYSAWVGQNDITAGTNFLHVAMISS